MASRTVLLFSQWLPALYYFPDSVPHCITSRTVYRTALLPGQSMHCITSRTVNALLYFPDSQCFALLPGQCSMLCFTSRTEFNALLPGQCSVHYFPDSDQCITHRTVNSALLTGQCSVHYSPDSVQCFLPGQCSVLPSRTVFSAFFRTVFNAFFRTVFNAVLSGQCSMHYSPDSVQCFHYRTVFNAFITGQCSLPDSVCYRTVLLPDSVITDSVVQGGGGQGTPVVIVLGDCDPHTVAPWVHPVQYPAPSVHYTGVIMAALSDSNGPLGSTGQLLTGGRYPGCRRHYSVTVSLAVLTR